MVTNSDVLEDAEDPYIVCEMDGILVPFFVEDFRYKTDTVVLVKLEDVNSEEMLACLWARRCFILWTPWTRRISWGI